MKNKPMTRGEELAILKEVIKDLTKSYAYLQKEYKKLASKRRPNAKKR